MAWEERKRGGAYYYRSVRDGERVRKVYVGAGPVAELVSETDRIERERTEARRAIERRELEHLQSLSAPVLELDRAARILARAHLIASGYHRHKGEWRRARGEARSA